VNEAAGWPRLLISLAPPTRWVPHPFDYAQGRLYRVLFCNRVGQDEACITRVSRHSKHKRNLPHPRLPAPAGLVLEVETATAPRHSSGELTNPRFTGLQCMYLSFSTCFFDVQTLKS
jgi:hypothetical protein